LFQLPHVKDRISAKVEPAKQILMVRYMGQRKGFATDKARMALRADTDKKRA
jgi:hypothetical protein